MIQGTEYNRGASGVLFQYKNQPGLITKQTKKKNISQEYKIHTICYDVCKSENYQILKIPKPETIITHKSYAMEKIDDSEMIVQPEGLLADEMKKFIRKLEATGITAFDYELYLQCDGTVYMIDFDKFTMEF
jgi:hypothetical protein